MRISHIWIETTALPFTYWITLSTLLIFSEVQCVQVQSKAPNAYFIGFISGSVKKIM